MVVRLLWLDAKTRAHSLWPVPHIVGQPVHGEGVWELCGESRCLPGSTFEGSMSQLRGLTIGTDDNDAAACVVSSPDFFWGRRSEEPARDSNRGGVRVLKSRTIQ